MKPLSHARFQGACFAVICMVFLSAVAALAASVATKEEGKPESGKGMAYFISEFEDMPPVVRLTTDTECNRKLAENKEWAASDKRWSFRCHYVRHDHG